jgi:hypothetical protein
MSTSDDFRRCLEELDVAGVRQLWHFVQPNLPQPATDLEALVTLHVARTQAASIRFRLRAYSHRWLTDGGYPSMLPDELRPRAERMYPKIADAVGISVNMRSPDMKPLAVLIRQSMEDAVNECYADGKRDPVFVRARMMEARRNTLKKLLG